MKKYVSDMIGDEYKEWREGDSVIISTPTGSGKTSFVLSKLLLQAVEENMQVLYLCNRKVLSEQFAGQSRQKLIHEVGLSEEITNEAQKHIHVFTYQYYEKKHLAEYKFPYIDYLNPENQYDHIRFHPSMIKYFIFDEAHYFLGDALFNRNTNYWMDQPFNNGISVFLTATPELLEVFLASKQERSVFQFQKQAEYILEVSRRRQQKRSEMSKVQITANVNMKQGTAETIIKRTPQKQITEAYRQINPYNRCSEYIDSVHEALCKQGFIFYPREGVAPDYSQYDVSYFNESGDIIEMILNPQINQTEKWLIFVDSKNNGENMVKELNVCGCDAVFLSRENIERNKKSKLTYREIVEEQKYSCRVLITTPVLDCGINIIDEDVKNVVLFQHDRTTFIQSLGRKRLLDGEKVKLFIRVMSSKAIESFYRKYERQLDYVVKFCLRKVIDYKTSYERNGLFYENFLIKGNELDYLIENIDEGWAKALKCRSDLGPTYRKESDIHKYKSERDKHCDLYLAEWEFSKTAFLRLIYNIKSYQEALEDYYKTGDDYFFIKHQLRWLGKEFEQSCFLSYDGKVDKLVFFLTQMEGELLDKRMQLEFCQQCLDKILGLPIVLKSMKKDISRYHNKEMLPKKKKLNEIFEELGLNFIIQSSRKTNKETGKQETYWIVKRSTENER